MSDPRGVFGAAAAIRENRRIALDEIARSTKINLNYLRAIEHGEFDILPGGIYNISYIRQYARELDFDEQELVRAYGRTRAEELSNESEAAALRGEHLALGAALKRLGDFLSKAPAR
jgi:cytoskeletal protein RodZ